MHAVTLTAPAFMQRSRAMIVAGLLALALFAGAGATATRVGAEPVGPGIDGVSQACRGIQNQINDLIGEYGRVGRANANDPRLDDILAQLRSLGTTWNQIGCRAAFGNAALLAQGDTAVTVSQFDGGSLVVSNPTVTPRATSVFAGGGSQALASR